MRISILSDSNWGAKISHATRPLELNAFFDERDYGSGLSALCIILMCRDPDLQFRRRVRLDRKTRILYTDIMLEFSEMRSAGHAGRRNIIAQRLTAEISPTIGKYRLPDFDLPRFTEDFRCIVEAQLLGVEAGRYDHLCRE